MNNGAPQTTGKTTPSPILNDAGWPSMMALMPSMLVLGGILMAEHNDTIVRPEDIAEAFALAELRGDTDFLDRTLTDDFIGIGPRGFMLTKEQWLDRYRSGDLKNEEFTWDDVKARAYGDAAIITGRQCGRGAYKGHGIGGAFRGTLIAVRIQGNWQIAGLHLSSIAEGGQ